MTKPFNFAALIAAAPLVLSACAGTNLRASFDQANAHSIIHTPVAPTEVPARASLPVAQASPKIKVEQVLLDPSSVVRNGRGTTFLALDGKQTARVHFDCPSHSGNFRENGVFETFSLDFVPRLTKAALEACGELPMPEPLTADQKRLVNPNPTKADYERAHTDFICGSFSGMPLDQQLNLIESAKTDPGIRKEIEPCVHAMRASVYQ